MSRRIEIELTSLRGDGSWTWRAAGAKEPRGVVESSMIPSGAKVGEVLRAEVEADLDGNRVLSVSAPKAKNERTGLLQILPSDKPFEPVTQQSARRERRDGDKRGGDRRDGDRRGRRGPGSDRGPRGDRPPRGERTERGDRSERGPRPDRTRRAFTEPPPELPTRPKPKRVRAQRVHVDAVLSELPEAQRAIAEKVLAGGLPAVRTAIEAQNTRNVAEGKEKIPAEGLLTIAENLLPRLRIAEWRDRAVAAEKIIDDVDIRDLRQIVVTAAQLVAPDEDTRALVARMQAALATRQEVETKNWLDDIAAATGVGRVVRALRMSSQPPKAGVRFPPALAMQLATATSAGLTSDAPADRWSALLEAAAFSPIRTLVVPISVPSPAPDTVMATVTRLAPLMPQVASLFGVTPDPAAKAPRPLQLPRPARGKPGDKPGDKPRRPESGKPGERRKGGERAPGGPGERGKPRTQPAATDAASGESVPAVSASVESPAESAPVETPVESSVVETPAEPAAVETLGAAESVAPAESGE
ncbi:MAG: hypothetical protein ACKOCC_01470 [Actinomycetota bacterium]